VLWNTMNLETLARLYYHEWWFLFNYSGKNEFRNIKMLKVWWFALFCFH